MIIILLTVVIMTSTTNTSALDYLVGPEDGLMYVLGESHLINWTYYPDQEWVVCTYVITDEARHIELQTGEFTITDGEPLEIYYDLIELPGGSGPYELRCLVDDLDFDGVDAYEVFYLETYDPPELVGPEEPILHIIGSPTLISWSFSSGGYPYPDGFDYVIEDLYDNSELQSGHFYFAYPPPEITLELLSQLEEGLHPIKITIYPFGESEILAEHEVDVTVYSAYVMPSIDPHPDITCVYGDYIDFGWTASATDPDFYEVRVNGELIQDGYWTNTIWVDIYLVASETEELIVECTVWDSLGFSAVDDFVITVLPDDSVPVIFEAPADVVAYESAYFNYENIFWLAYDDHPDYYEVYLDGDMIWADIWDLDFILNFAVGDIFLDVGIHEAVCYVYDIAGNMASDTVMITIKATDYTPPEISDTPDKYYTNPNEQIVISWSAYDVNPYLYTINLDDVFIESGSWSNTENILYISEQNLDPGIYTFECIVFDELLHYASDIVVVTIGSSTSKVDLKLSGSFDYLEKEEINIQIAGILTDSLTGAIIVGATISFEIYNPLGALIVSGNFVEISPGIYVYNSGATVKDLKDIFAKGIYIVYAHAVTQDGLDAYDLIEFHIDPPGETAVTMPVWVVSMIVGVVALSSGSIGGFYLRKLKFK